MIYLHLHSATHIAISNCYAYKDAIRALADYPDVKWDAASRRWLVHAGLIDKVLDALGEHITATADFWLDFPLPQPSAPKPARKVPYQQREMERRKQKQIDRRHAKRWGKMFAEAVREERGA